MVVVERWPFNRPLVMVMVVLVTFGIVAEVFPSMTRSKLLSPTILARLMVAEVPVNVNETPVPGQVSSLVAGLTRPRKRYEAAAAAGAGMAVTRLAKRRTGTSILMVLQGEVLMD